MQRSAWIFLAAIFLPSLGLAWLAVHSVQDQQIVLEHQQAIISQNITDALAQNIQQQMDQVRGDFVKTSRQMLDQSASPEILAANFNRKIHDAWPLAEVGFAVNLNGEIYSPEPYDGPGARTFRDENDRFLSNRENVEVYSSNSLNVAQGGSIFGNANGFGLKLRSQVTHANADMMKDEAKVTAPMLTTATASTGQGATPPGSAFNIEAQKKIAPASDDAASNAPVTVESAYAPRAVSEVKTVDATGKVSAASASAASSDLSVDSLKAAAVGRAYRASPALDSAAAKDEGSGSSSLPATVSTAPAALPVPAAAAMPASDNSTGLSPSPTVQPAPPVAAESADSAKNETVGGAVPNMFGAFAKVQRQVIPQQMATRETAPLSNTVPEESDFRRVIGAETSGMLARFLENKMRLLVWSHPSVDSPIVFGAQLDQAKLIEALKTSFQIPELAPDSFAHSGSGEICVAILDDAGQPVALSREGFHGDWKHPFVATEIGEVLPHWEAALYLVDPNQISRAARTLRATLGLIVLLLVAAIISGGSLIAADVRRQVRLAQQKTDFVSNVSHELKTPLTSIRMFADLLAEKRVPEEARQATYLRIISAEAARLTRLINNVLDFARLEKGAPPGEPRACDLLDAVRDVVETCGPHLEAAGVAFRCEIEAETLPISGDRDALAQIVLNLISNAEKYGGNDVLVRVRRQETASGALGCVDVLDRGAGIPARQVRTVFEPFHRLDDSLASGVPGSGLGLTLARRMARAHGGDVTYSARAGSGSCFTLAVPLRAAEGGVA